MQILVLLTIFLELDILFIYNLIFIKIYHTLILKFFAKYNINA